YCFSLERGLGREDDAWIGRQRGGIRRNTPGRRSCVRSHAMSRLLSLPPVPLVFLALTGLPGAVAPSRSAAPPARLTAAQQQRLQESDRLFRQANTLFEEGKK